MSVIEDYNKLNVLAYPQQIVDNTSYFSILCPTSMFNTLRTIYCHARDIELLMVYLVLPAVPLSVVGLNKPQAVSYCTNI